MKWMPTWSLMDFSRPVVLMLRWQHDAGCGFRNKTGWFMDQQLRTMITRAPLYSWDHQSYRAAA